jgi:hypothetical protein
VTREANLAAAEKQLSKAEEKAFEIACQHAYMKLAFEKPWVHLQLMTSKGSTRSTSSMMSKWVSAVMIRLILLLIMTAVWTRSLG